MIVEECPHGLEPAWCSLCLHPPPRPAPVTVGAKFVAGYPGTCVVCRETIHLGETIAARLVDGGAAGYLHEECIP